MQIFVTSNCPIECARILDNRRVVKMVLETAQILSTVIRQYDETYAETGHLYKATHTKHPCVLWAIEHLSHAYWLAEHGQALAEEYTLRYGKVHKSEIIIDKCRYWLAKNISINELELPKYFCNCTPYKTQDVHMAYLQLLNDKWDEDEAKGHSPKFTIQRSRLLSS